MEANKQAEVLINQYKHHAPKSDKIAALHGNVRQELFVVANWINELLPRCREKSLALTKLEEAMFWANAAIARNQEVIENGSTGS